VVAIKAHNVEAFLSKLPSGIDAILVYGPDHGLVHERLSALISHFASDPSDPFCVSYLHDADITRDPGSLNNSLFALAFGSEKRTVVVRIADLKTATIVAKSIDEERAANLLVSAGDLRPSSPLRKIFESSATCAAVPCYADDNNAIGRLIDRELLALDQTIDPEAKAMLTSRLGSDRSSSKSEIEKLSLYAGPNRTITVSDIAAICSDVSQISLDQLCDAIAFGDLDKVERSFSRAIESGTAPSQIIRTVLMHFQRLHILSCQLIKGGSAASAVTQFRPPIYFQRRDGIIRQLTLWNDKKLRRALDIAASGERLSRGEATIAMTSVSRSLLRIAMLLSTTKKS
jgi:DNA polymerase-3 subunit delta